ncbi:MAG: hypothetical protein RIS47_1264 [Bacteroidota bacterium]|jgi:diaminopimelate epimerase
MNLAFSKYQGAGNDFILVDNRKKVLTNATTEQIAKLCDRRFGIGADGLMLLEEAEGYDFRMIYYNSDGREGSMCGNGGRCITAFAAAVGAISAQTTFIATDGPHEAEILADGTVRLKMIDVTQVENIAADCYLNTGSPHYVRFTDNIHTLNVYAEGRSVRYNERFAAIGTNVNFVSQKANLLEVATYERGVEDETLACGTGVVAASMAACLASNGTLTAFDIRTKGGKLHVDFAYHAPAHFTNVWLQGPAEFVFSGEIIV